MASHLKREKYINELLNVIQQQRLDVSTLCCNWNQNTAKYDHLWLTFIKVRRYLIFCRSILRICSIIFINRQSKKKSNHRILRWVKYSFKLWNISWIIKSLIHFK